jgi:hypothetical protein
MIRLAVVLMLAWVLVGCAHEDLKAPCRHPSFLDEGCGPLNPIP